MADIKGCVKITNKVLGLLTIGMGFFLLILYIMNMSFHIKMFPIYLMPFFLAFLGLMVLSNEYEYPVIKENCKFLDHKIGVVFFYIYLSALMGHFAGSVESFGHLPKLISIGTSIGYLVLGVLFGLISCFGEGKVNEKVDGISDKITKD